jgi:hypothetical protein
MRILTTERNQRQRKVATGIVSWQRTIGPPAPVPALQARAEGDPARHGMKRPTRFGVDLSQIPIHPTLVSNFQAKLRISAGDALEQEADRLAEQVMRPEETQVGRDDISGVERSNFQPPPPITTDSVQTKRATESELGQTAVPPVVHEVLHSPGRPLNMASSAFMGSRLGYDFSRVRVHADAGAADAARTVGARAYTVGRDIVFGAGEYAPSTPGGRRLLAHELTHVMQQQAPGATHILSRQPDGGNKKEDDPKKETGDKTKSEDKADAKDKKQSKEDQERERLAADLTDGSALTPKQVGRVASAMRAFSLSQLHAMQKAGLRFWQGDSLPPEFAGRVEVKNISSPAEYLDVIHVIRIADNGTTDAIRHEIAHAWDHARTGKLKPLGKLNDTEFSKAVENTPELSSATKEKRLTKETVAGKERAARLPMSEMLERYKKWTLREQSFDNPSTRAGYSKSSPREFYAEGYSVFHGGCIECQARLLYYAPELYNLLEGEAKKEGLPVPDRSQLDAELKAQRLQP